MKHEKNANATEILCAILQLILCICNLLVSRMFIVRPLYICIPQIKSHHVNHTHTQQWVKTLDFVIHAADTIFFDPDFSAINQFVRQNGSCHVSL